MKAIFKGGPWDGFEFDAPLLPNQLILRMLCPSQEGPPPKGTIDLGQEHEHHVYSAKGRRVQSGVTLVVGENISRDPEEGEDICDLVDDDALEVLFEHTPNAKTWLDAI